MVKKKQCFKCGAVKLLRDFYKHGGMGDGHLNKCKECAKEDSRNVDKVKRSEYDANRQRTPERREAKLRYQADARARNPEKFHARGVLFGALRRGKIVKGPCEDCGKLSVEAHHADYSKPLEVTWLCQRCHKARHKDG